MAAAVALLGVSDGTLAVAPAWDDRACALLAQSLAQAGHPQKPLAFEAVI